MSEQAPYDWDTTSLASPSSNNAEKSNPCMSKADLTSLLKDLDVALDNCNTLNPQDSDLLIDNQAALVSASLNENIGEPDELHDIFQVLSNIELHVTLPFTVSFPLHPAPIHDEGKREQKSCENKGLQPAYSHSKEQRIGQVEQSTGKQPVELDETPTTDESPSIRQTADGSRHAPALRKRRHREQRRRERINAKLTALQELIPGSEKKDQASIREDAITYMKSLKLQVDLMARSSGMNHVMMMSSPTLATGQLQTGPGPSAYALMVPQPNSFGVQQVQPSTQSQVDVALPQPMTQRQQWQNLAPSSSHQDPRPQPPASQ